MIHISQVLTIVDRQLKHMKPKEAVQFKTYKQDRGFLIYCVDNSVFQLIETGCNNQSSIGDARETRRLVKKSLKREFPRSNKVWVEYFHSVDNPSNISHLNSHQIPLF
ncbi:TPA: hypothetical protein I7750_21580 [Vibrio vulnificus]|nr:hypothetical protein [Vibrio vulnificus]